MGELLEATMKAWAKATAEEARITGIFERALEEAQAFHDFQTGSRIYSPDQLRQIGETARIIARRRGWRPLVERLADIGSSHD